MKTFLGLLKTSANMLDTIATVLIILKLLHLINWEWWQVTIPIDISVVIGFILWMVEK
jgi:hypothetical protein